MATQAEADRALAFHQNSLFERNFNLVKVSVVEETPGNFILEAGVLRLAVQREATALGVGKATELVPDELNIPDDTGAITQRKIRVRIVEVGEISCLGLTGSSSPSSVSTLAFTNRVQPVDGGNSAGNPRYNDAGTLGGVVRLKYDNDNRYFISNWHVFVRGGGRLGDNLIQPGRFDGGSTPNDVIGYLHWFLLNSEFDVALGVALQPWQTYVQHGFRCYPNYNPIPVNATNHRPVTKCGRTTEKTHGTILSTNATTRVPGYPTGTRLFANQIETTSMAQPGDSGSILFESDKMNPVGLVFAGGATRTYHNKLKLLFDRHFNTMKATMPDGTEIDLPELHFESL